MQNSTINKVSTKMSFSHRDFLGIEALNADEISFILDLAERYVVQNRRRPQTNSLLKGFVMINLFLENSTRTRLSFEMAAKRLGADVINMTTEGSSIKKGESFIDTLKTLNSLCPDIFVVRSKEEGAARASAEIMECPVINAGDGTNEHPTQAMLDALTLRRHFGRLDGLNIAICGDIIHGRVAHSNVLLLEKMGVHIKLVGPSELLPPNLENATTDMQEGLKDADAVMVLRIQEERLQKSLSFTSDEYFKSYGLTEEKLAWAKKDAVVLHPGPILRGAEIDATIADNPKRSLVTTQVEMGIAVRMACLDLLTRYKR